MLIMINNYLITFKLKKKKTVQRFTTLHINVYIFKQMQETNQMSETCFTD